MRRVEAIFMGIETSAFSTWLRESSSLWVFPFILILHTWGLAFLAGSNVVLDVRVLGLVPDIPLRSLERYFLVMWIAFWVNAVSGVLLLIAYPTKALTNPLFYVKLMLIAVAFVTAHRIRRRLREVPSGARPEASRLRMLAAVSLACWVAAVPAGRFLAYTCTRLTFETTC
jgi:hypothetical protein